MLLLVGLLWYEKLGPFWFKVIFYVANLLGFEESA